MTHKKQDANELPKTGVEVLARALEIWGPNGEKWCKGRWHTHNSVGFGQHCMLGGMHEAVGRVNSTKSRPFIEALTLVKGALKSQPIPFKRSIIGFNDSSSTTFSDVKNLVCGIIKREIEKEDKPSD